MCSYLSSFASDCFLGTQFFQTLQGAIQRGRKCEDLYAVGCSLVDGKKTKQTGGSLQRHEAKRCVS